MIIMIGSINVQLISQRITIERRVTMLALGDSYTIGESVPVSERWPHQFAEALRQEGVDAPDPDYIATTGWTTGNLLQAIKSSLDRKKEYNLVSILIGVNNQYQGRDITAYEPDLREIIDSALAVADHVKERIFILSIPDYAYTPFGNGNERISQEIDAYNQIKQIVASEYGIVYIDVTKVSRRGLDEPDLVAGDGLHPSGIQYGLWVREILPYLGILPAASSSVSGISGQSNLFRLHPNPASSCIRVIFNERPEFVRILDLKGNTLMVFPDRRMHLQIDLSDLSPGIYFLEGAVADKRNVQRFVRY